MSNSEVSPESTGVPCPNCATLLPEGLLFCPICRQKLIKAKENILSCHNCNSGLVENARYCHKCRADVEEYVKEHECDGKKLVSVDEAQSVTGEQKCPHCEKTLFNSALFCPYCRESFYKPADSEKKEKVCPTCKTPLLPKANFCYVCAENVIKLQGTEEENDDWWQSCCDITGKVVGAAASIVTLASLGR